MRALTKTERIEARHLLQELSENAKAVRNAMDPLHGMMTITDEQWEMQFGSLTEQLRYFTEKVCK